MPLPRVRLIGVASSLGAPFAGSEHGPAVLQQRTGWPMTILEPGAGGLGELLQRIASTCAHAIHAGEFPVVIGGDHAMAAGTWRGIGDALGQAPGLLWIDAHLDAHTPDSTPSGNAHGMPVAALLGEGSPAMTQLPGPDLDPQRLVVLGGRSYETAEHDRLMAAGAHLCLTGEIAEIGLSTAITQALSRLDSRPWGLSLDIDVLDPEAAPGVSTPAPNGLAPAALITALRGLAHHPGCIALEIAEFNPARDHDGRTAHLVQTLIEALLAPSTP